MDLSSFFHLLYCYLLKFFPQEVDQSLKPIDSAVNEQARNMTYDFIVVGAGTTGCVLARRLSEIQDWKVLLIEAGGDEDYITELPILSGQYGISGTKYDWNYTTVPQKYLCTDSNGRCPYIRGHVMGGSGAVNSMVFSRASRIDFDKWASLGNPGWSYMDVLPYFKKSEHITIPELANSSYHSVTGPQYVSYAKFNFSFIHDYNEATLEQGFRPLDYNDEEPANNSYTPLVLKGSHRYSTSTGYINPIRQSTNLIIFKNTLVRKLIINSNTNEVEGVICITRGIEYNMYASKEVILSAGSINTPQLLMLSGIGPRHHLEQLGIQVLADLPVGEYSQDHPGLNMQFRSNITEINYDLDRLKQAILEYTQCKRGVLSAPRYQILSHYSDNISTPKSFKQNDTSIPYLAFAVGYDASPILFNDNTAPLSILVLDLVPNNTGTVKLNSTNIYDQPLIDPNYFTLDMNFASIRRGMDVILDYIRSPSLAKHALEFVYPQECQLTRPVSNEFIRCFLKHSEIAIYHMTSTAKMGPPSDKTTVVDSKLKVHGINKLRVVDASIMPTVTRGFPYANLVMIGEKAADIIRCFYAKKKFEWFLNKINCRTKLN